MVHTQRIYGIQDENYHTQRIYDNQDENYRTQPIYDNQDKKYRSHQTYDTQDKNYCTQHVHHAPSIIHENSMLTSNSSENNIFTPLDTDPVPTSEQYTPSNEPPEKFELTKRCELEPTVDDSIHMNRKIYRPPLESVYIEPDIGPDLLEGMQLLYQQYGKSLRKQVAPLPPRDDIIDFNMSSHGTELEKI